MLTPFDLDAYWFKKEPRPGQLDAIRKAATALEGGKSAIIRAPTGFGKTSMGLIAVLPLIEADNRVFFAARTHAQNKQALREARLFNAHAQQRGLPLQLRVVPLVGKTKACQKMPPPKGGDWETFARQCQKLREQGRCEYFRKVQEYVAAVPPSFGPTGVIDAQEAAEFCEKERMCLYYYLLAHVETANLLVGSYNYVLSPVIRQVLAQDGAFELEDLAVIFDEAHNLPDLCRKLASRELARKMLDDAQQVFKDREKFLAQRLQDFQGDAPFRQQYPATWQFLVTTLAGWGENVRALAAGTGDFQVEFHAVLADRLALLPKYDRDRYEAGHEVEVKLDPGVLDSLLPPADLALLANPATPPYARRQVLVTKYLEATYESLWEVIDDARFSNGDLARELPPEGAAWVDFITQHQLGGEKLETFGRTPVHAIIRFIAHRVQYLTGDTRQFAFITHARRVAPLYYKLDIACFDARVSFAFVRDQCAGLVCLSGSMDARDLDMLGIRAASRGWQDISDFRPLVPADHWLVLVDPEDMTDRVLKAGNKWQGIAARIAAIAAETPGGVGVFCRNYEHVDRLARYLVSPFAGKKVFVEESGEKRNPAFINDFKDTARRAGAILLACTSGKYGEGEDFPGAEMNAAIVVGLPYPPRTPTQLGLAGFLETLFPGQGEQVAFDEAAVKRVAQVAGRCVRSETDRGLILLIDGRMGSEAFVEHLPGALQDIVPVEDYAAVLPRIRKFFAPYLDFLLQLGRAAAAATDPATKGEQVKIFLGACKYYFSEHHPPWARDPKLAGQLREIQQLKAQLRGIVP